jgi:hypothetical protein
LDGPYRVRILGADTENRSLVGEQEVQVAGRDLDGLTIALTPGITVKGSVRIEGPASEPVSAALGQVYTTLSSRSDSGSAYFSTPVADGAFEIEHLFSGKYYVTFRAVNPFYVSAARSGDHDLLAEPEIQVSSGSKPEIELVLRADGGTVDVSMAPGAVRDEMIFAVLVPEAPSRTPEVANSDEASFTFEAVAPGSYRLHVWRQSDTVGIQSPEVLRTLATTGTRIEIRAQTKTQVRVDGFSEIPK